MIRNDYDIIGASLSSLLSLSAQVIYLSNIHSGKIKPSILSWIGWGLLTGLGWVIEYISAGWSWGQFAMLTSSCGCFSIACYSYVKNAYMVNKSDWKYFYAGLVCIVFYLISNDNLLTIILAVISDLVLSLPTFTKTLKDSSKERSSSWILGLIAWTISFILSFEGEPSGMIFPAYLFAFNLIMVVLIYWLPIRSR